MEASISAEMVGNAAMHLLQPLAMATVLRDETGEIVDLRWDFVNEAAATQLEMKPEELLGKTFIDTHPDVRDELLPAYRRVMETGETYFSEAVTYVDSTGRRDTAPKIYSIRATRCGADAIAISWLEITDILADRDQLAAANNRLRHFEDIVERAGLGIWAVDHVGATTYVNQALCEMLGIPREEVLGHVMDEFVTSSSAVSPTVSAADSVSTQQVVTFRNSGGHDVWAKVTTTAVQGAGMGELGGHVSIISDITAEKIAQQHQRTAESRTEQATANAPVGQALIDLDGRIVSVNHAYSELSGYSQDEAIGREFRIITNPRELGIDPARIRSLREGEIPSFDVEKQYIHPDGESSWARVFVSLLRDADGNPTHYFAQAIDIDSQKDAEATAAAAISGLEYRSTHDPLTELPNRNECIRLLHQALAGARSERKPAVLFIDVDRFKEVNDGVSHGAGDTVLNELAKRIEGSVGDRGLVGRLGGDEFAVITTGTEDPDTALQLAEKIRAAVARNSFRISNVRLHISVSVGVALAHHDSTPQSLLSEADLALHRAKAQGRNQCAVADREMLQAAQERVELLDRMHDGLARDEFHAWYQPIVDLQSRDVVGYEALARWQRDDGIIRAMDFIRVAEDSGLIHLIGANTIAEAIDQLARTDSHLFMAINASPHQLQTPTFATRILSAIARTGADPRRLGLEITEQALLDGGKTCEANIAAIHQAGVRLYVDDFGVGYSSLAILRDYPIAGIKLDRSFSIDHSRLVTPRAKLVSGLSELAEHLGMERIAEGIEDENQLDYLIETGWTHGQGYLFGDALPAIRSVEIPSARKGTAAVSSG